MTKNGKIWRDGTYTNKKTGKLLTSHRYNQTPLLHSCPGGFIGSWPYKTYQWCKGNNILFILPTGAVYNSVLCV